MKRTKCLHEDCNGTGDRYCAACGRVLLGQSAQQFEQQGRRYLRILLNERVTFVGAQYSIADRGTVVCFEIDRSLVPFG